MEENTPRTENKERGQPLGALVLLMLLPLIGGIVGYFAAVLVTYVQPKQFESTVVMQVHPAAQALDPFGGTSGQVPLGSVSSAQFFPTEMQVITADMTLQRVVERLDLTRRWSMSPDNVLTILREIVVAEPLEGTDLVEVRVVHTVPEDARDIAKQVAVAYGERRVAMEMDRAHSALSALDTEIRDQEDLVEEKRQVLDTVVQTLGIPWMEGEPAGEGGAARAEVLRRSAQIVFELESEKKQLDLEVDMLLKMESEALVTHLLNSDHPPAGLRELRREHRVEAEVLAGLEVSGMPDWDEKLIAQRARVEILAKEIQEAVVGFREGVVMKRKLMEGRLIAAREAQDHQNDQAVDSALDAHDFNEARREYERALAMFEALRTQHASQRIALKIPRSPVTIHAESRIGFHPVSPNVGANLTMGVVVGAAVGLILAVIVGVVRTRTGPDPEPDDGWAD